MKVDELLPGVVVEAKGVAEPERDWSEWDEKIARLKKLAKSGPLKTVWDPVKRVYRNVPEKDPVGGSGGGTGR